MKIDDLLREIGEFGPYQQRVYVLASLGSVLIAFETLTVIFIFNMPLHRCALPNYPDDTYKVQNETHERLINMAIPRTSSGQFDQCHVFDDFTDVFNNVTLSTNESEWKPGNASQTKCSRWVFDYSVFHSTVTDDLGIVCDRSLDRAVSNMISETGTLLGGFISGIVADRFGRKTTFYTGGVALISGGFAIAFTHSLLTFNICRFILGLARNAVFLNGFVIGMEIVGPSKRTFAGVAVEVIWCAGEFLLLIFAYFIRDWRYLEIAVSVPSIGLLFYWWLIPESPRWLLSRNRKKEAMAVFEKIAASNKTKMPFAIGEEVLLEEKPNLGYRHLFRSRELVFRIIVIFSNIFVMTIVYYGLTLNITNLSGDVFVNYTINVCLELAAYVFPYFILDRVGRKPVQACSMILGGVFCVGSIFLVMLDSPAGVVVGLSMAGRFCVCTGFAVVYLYGAELFPTVIRSMAMGVAFSLGRLGSVLSPYAADVGILVGGQFQDALPLIVMGSPAILVGVLTLWLPETSGKTLPETIEDLEIVKCRDKCMCCARLPSLHRHAKSEDNDANEKMTTLL